MWGCNQIKFDKVHCNVSNMVRGISFPWKAVPAMNSRVTVSSNILCSLLRAKFSPSNASHLCPPSPMLQQHLRRTTHVPHYLLRLREVRFPAHAHTLPLYWLPHLLTSLPLLQTKLRCYYIHLVNFVHGNKNSVQMICITCSMWWPLRL